MSNTNLILFLFYFDSALEIFFSISERLFDDFVWALSLNNLSLIVFSLCGVLVDDVVSRPVAHQCHAR